MSKFQIVKGITDNLEDTPYVEGKVYFTYEDTESEDISIYADIDGVRRKIKEGVQEEELNNYLLKTDIAAWAKESTKPTYTANEVGALSTSHPAATITTNQITQWNNKSNFSGSYNDLTEKPTIPTKTSELTNDSGFLTEEIDPTIHVITLERNWDADLDAEVISLPTNVTYENISTWTNNNEIVVLDSGASQSFRYFYFTATDRNELIFVNPSGNQYSVYSDNTVQYYSNGYLYYSDLPTNVSDFNNDAEYITQETDPTVPAWAKESTKPTYTAAEVGALPDTTVIPDEKLKTERISDNGTYYLIFGANNTTTSSTKNIDNNLQYIKSSSSDKLEIGSRSVTTPKRGQITLSNGTTSGTTITPGASSQFATITLPKSTGTLALISDIPTVPENVSDLTNDSGFQTSTEVNSAIATAIGNINQFNVAIVSTLPTENIDGHTIYFMSNGGSDDSIYDEWMYINNNWEKIGTTAVDLSGYMQTSHPANGITSTDISNWDKKSNLWTVGSKRSGDEYYWTLAISQSSLWNLNNTPGSDSGIGYITLPINRNGNVYKNVQLQLPITSGTVALTSDIPTMPTNISSFTNDSGYLTSYTETDPTVPAWAKAVNKPTYTAAEVGALPDTTVIPDISGKVNKSGDTMTGTLNMGRQSLTFTNDGADYSQTTTLSQDYTKDSQNNNMGYLKVNGRIQCSTTPALNNDLTNKQYVDNVIPKVYSSTNTTGYLTMDTLPIYDGTVV